MAARAARFEVVRTDAGWHARFRAANGRIITSTEVYNRRQGALDAIATLGQGNKPAVRDKGHGLEVEWYGTRPWSELLEVREIDEREQA